MSAWRRNLKRYAKLIRARRSQATYLEMVPNTPPPTIISEGNLWVEDGVLNFGSPHEGVVAQIPNELWTNSRNESGSTIEDGSPVTGTGFVSGQRPLIQLAIADDPDLAIPLGIATHDIDNGNNGVITTDGIVRGIQTDGADVGESWASDDCLYVHPTIAGKLTNIMPVPPYEVSRVGTVQIVHPSNGSILVRIATSSATYNGRYAPSGYGEINVDDGVATEAITTTPVKLDAFVNNGLSSSTTPDAANDRITINVAGKWKVMFQASFKFSPGNVVIESHININQVEQGQGFHRKIATAGDEGSASCFGIFDLSAGDQIEIFTNTVTGSGNITIIDGQLIAERIG
jgi:hypothetical protein